jgi:hypothetical protein
MLPIVDITPSSTGVGAESVELAPSAACTRKRPPGKERGRKQPAAEHDKSVHWVGTCSCQVWRPFVCLQYNAMQYNTVHHERFGIRSHGFETHPGTSQGAGSQLMGRDLSSSACHSYQHAQATEVRTDVSEPGLPMHCLVAVRRLSQVSHCHSPARAPAGAAGVAPTAVVDARRAAAAASAVLSTWSRPPLSCVTRPDVSSRVLDSRAEAMRAARMRLVRPAFLQGNVAAVAAGS